MNFVLDSKGEGKSKGVKLFKLRTNPFPQPWTMHCFVSPTKGLLGLIHYEICIFFCGRLAP